MYGNLIKLHLKSIDTLQILDYVLNLHYPSSFHSVILPLLLLNFLTTPRTIAVMMTNTRYRNTFYSRFIRPFICGAFSGHSTVFPHICFFFKGTDITPLLCQLPLDFITDPLLNQTLSPLKKCSQISSCRWIH